MRFWDRDKDRLLDSGADPGSLSVFDQCECRLLGLCLGHTTGQIRNGRQSLLP